MKKVTYILFYVSLILYEIFAMNQVVAWQLDTESSSNRLVLLVFFMAGLLFVALSKKNVSQSSFGKSFIFFYGYLLLISALHGVLNGFENRSALLDYTLPFICFFVEYYAQYDFGLKKLRRILVLACFIILSANYLINYQVVSIATGDAIVGTNASYFILYFLPILCFVTNQKLHKYNFIIVAFMVLLSTKRGETLGLALGIIMYIYIRIRQSQTLGRYGIFRIFSILTSIVVVLAILYFINNLYGGFLFERLIGSIDDEGSGRLTIFEDSIDLIKKSDAIGRVFGHGYNAVKYKLVLSAHNDFLEIIYDFGYICVLLFMVFVVKGFVCSFKHHDLEIRPILGLSFSIMLVCSLISVIVVRTYYLNLLALCWGAASGIPKYYSSITKKKTSHQKILPIHHQ